MTTIVDPCDAAKAMVFAHRAVHDWEMQTWKWEFLSSTPHTQDAVIKAACLDALSPEKVTPSLLLTVWVYLTRHHAARFDAEMDAWIESNWATVTAQ